MTIKEAPVEWRCFHCDEVFTDERCARDHFGGSEDCEAACKIKMGAERSMLTALRRAEADAADAWFKLQNESGEAAKAYYAQSSRHQEQLRVAEELGFERGLTAQLDALPIASAGEAGWRDISTAPENKPVLLRWIYWSALPIIGILKYGKWEAADALTDDGPGPTHWHVIPPFLPVPPTGPKP